jgi:hypothetical protein
MLGALARWGPHVMASAVGSFFAPERPCHCHVELGSFPSPDSAVLDLLRSQLERCGPEALRCPAARECPIGAPPAAPELTYEFLTIFVFVAFIGGFFLGRLPQAPAGSAAGSPQQALAAAGPAEVAAVCRAAPVTEQPLPPLAPARERLATTGLTPATLKILKDGRASADAGSA